MLLNGHLDHSEGPACPSFQSRAGEHRWEDSPATVASPRHSSSSCSGREIAWESKNRGQELPQLYKSKHRLGEVFQVNDCCVPLKLRAKWQERKMQAHRVPFLVKSFAVTKVILAISIKYLLYFQGIHLPKSSKEKQNKTFFFSILFGEKVN